MVLCSILDVFKKIAGKCVEPIVGYVTTEVGHLSNYKANIENLRAEVQNLKDATHDLKARIEDARNRTGATQVAAVAQTSLDRMTDLNEEASRIIRDEERETERCLMGLRPNLWACYVASKSAKKVMDDAVELKKVGESITTVAHVDYSQALGCAINRDFEELESRKEASEQIVDFLKDPSVKMVGMYGMGGAGKTTLAEKIGEKLLKAGIFRDVVKTNVSNNQKTDLKDIQKEIADVLKICLGEKDSLTARANLLREQLVKKDKLLIILDDVWSSFKLTDVGIPVDRELKILITSRNLDVMNDLDSEHNVQLDSLSDDDAWKLFNKMAGGVAPHSDLYSTARAVVEKCGGIPVLLVTIARSLRERDLETWKEALTQLERFEGDKFVDDGYKRIEVTYNFLPDNELRSLFLLCSQLDHRSILIDDLLRYAMGLGLFPTRKKLKEVSQRLHLHLGDLKGYCLLQDGNIKGTVRMHDVIHKFAAFVAYRDRRMFTVADNQLEEWPPKDGLEQFSAITLPYCLLPNHQLPKAFDSSKLESFIWHKRWEDASLNVPEKFFIGMKELKLVDLRRVPLLPVLPSSLNVLIKLRTLCLDYCALNDIAIIGELPMLQVLSLKGSTVSHVPNEIGRLGSSLKLLDLRDCSKLKVIASGVFSNLTLLEDLRIGDSFVNWEQLQGCSRSTDHETTSTTTKKLASLREFKNLGNLINLEIWIPNPKATFLKDLVFEKLERFAILFGQDNYWLFKDSGLGTLKVNHVEDIQLYKGIKTLVGKANRLHLEAVKGVTSVCELAPKGFPELKDLTIKQAVEIQFIVKTGYNNCAVFPKLEYLKFERMRKLERIIRDDHDCLFPVESLQNLTTIDLERCDVLKYLFLSRHLASLRLCLKEIRLRDCKSMNAIIVDDDRCQLDEIEGGEITQEFTQLRALKLRRLPGLISFYSNTPNPIICSSQERQEKDPILFIVEDNQRLLTSLFDKKVVLPNLESLDLWRIQVDEIWDNQLAIESTNCWFQHLTILKVYYCHNLSYLFTSSMVKSLAQLKTLQVSSCSSIEEIVATKGEMTEDDVMLSFPALDTLLLKNLPKFKRFCHDNLFECHSLQKLEVRECGRWDNNGSSPASLDANSSSIFFHKNVVLPKLKELELTIQDNRLPIAAERTSWFQHLTILKLMDCDNLSYLFTSSMVKSLAQLKTLEVSHCRSIEEIVATKGEMTEDDVMLSFPALDTLQLRRLPKFERLCYANTRLECQSLQKLVIWESGRWDNNGSSPASLDANSSSIFSHKNVVLPKLKELELTIKDNRLAIAAERTNCWFQNLTNLKVEYCRNLSYLFTFSMAKSLAHLEYLSLEECQSLKEIVSKEEASNNSTGDIIVFGKLKTLYLASLTSLISFCSTTNCNFQFPSLDEVTLYECPSMEFFSEGTLSTPNLSMVRVRGPYAKDEGQWEGDLNSTVRQLYKGKMNSTDEHLKLNDEKKLLLRRRERISKSRGGVAQ